MIPHNIPSELRVTHRALYAIRRPPEPTLRNAVAESEAIPEDDNLHEWIRASLVPWWDDTYKRPEMDSLAYVDYIIGGIIAFSLSFFLLDIFPGIGYSIVFSIAITSVVLALYALAKYHINHRKCLTMVVFNRVCRRKWMGRQPAEDELRLQKEIAYYPTLLSDYEDMRANAIAEAEAALKAYHSTNPEQRYTIGEDGFKPVTP